MSTRRYYLRARRLAERLGDTAVASAFQTKQLAEPGTPLPADFPCRTKLEAAGYVAREDLDPDAVNGADVDELVREAGLTLSQARAVLKAAVE